MTGPRQTPGTARAVTLAAPGRDPGPMVVAESSSHDVYVGADVVVKLIDADRHSRLDREITLVPSCPPVSRPRCSPAAATRWERAVFAMPATPAS
ncbi:MAG TPA: hypothetical protein VGD91_24525, partial [Trebonia sp.]